MVRRKQKTRNNSKTRIMDRTKMVIANEFRLIQVKRNEKAKRSTYEKGYQKLLREGCLITREHAERVNENFKHGGLIYEIDEVKTEAYYDDCEIRNAEIKERDEKAGALKEVLADTVKHGLEVVKGKGASKKDDSKDNSKELAATKKKLAEAEAEKVAAEAATKKAEEEKSTAEAKSKELAEGSGTQPGNDSGKDSGDGTPDINEELDAARKRYFEVIGKKPNHNKALKNINKEIEEHLNKTK